ncbi:phage tail tape measure protein [Deinococcus cellulosilyticus]|uniref:Phage tail tape measure protein domain-containing protein n=1 Tax=Deinococcus cellulosilyticus (strain DSM 18568 / NBRC 106333 / KACC 11606 / 5516J-15) TaxID=1223518 RepID=A0A511MW79_DEIC1|nr:phage tail tape measure protein [Deinococcus cellulosilyticus]GEM44833.1 hypothetical protein DC3_04680 [Deinococcus cellulosilyticus NBRC 106333 = KACC 11606]
MSAFNLQVLINLVDRLSGPLQEPIRRLQELENHAERVDRSMRMMQTGAGVMGAGVGLAAPLIFSANEAIKLEDKMAEVRKVFDELESPKAFREMTNDIREMSNVIPMVATDLAEIGSFAAASKLEPSRKGIMTMIEDSAKMGVAFDMTAEEAGSALAGMRNIFQLTEDGVVQLGDAINYLGNNTSARARDMVNFMSRAGAVGKQAGLTAMQTAALGNAFLALKTPPEIAARAVSQGLIPSLQTATRQGTKFAEAAAIIGLTAQEIQDNMKIDPQGTILDVLERINKTDNKMLVLTDLFGVGWADDIAKLSGSLDVYYKALGLVSDKQKYAGSMEKEYQGRINTTRTQLQLLWNSTVNFAGAMGDVYLPMISGAAKWMGKLGQGLLDLTEKHPFLVRLVMFSALAISLLTLAMGGTILTLGVFGFAMANASAGLVILKGHLAAAKLQVLALRNALIARITGGFIPSTAAQMALFGGATSLNQIALMGLKQALLQAARSAWAFTAAILANPITWWVTGILAVTGAFVYMWQTSHKVRAALKGIFKPLEEAWAGVRLAWVQLMTVFSSGTPGLDSQAKDLSKWGSFWKDTLDKIIYGVVYAMTFIGLVLADVALGFVNTWAGILTLTAGIMNILKGIFTGDMNLIKLGLEQAGDGITTIWDNNLLKPMVDAVMDWGPAILEGVKAAMGELWDLAGEWLNIGKTWISNLWDGIKGKWADLKQGAANLGWNIVEGITGGLVKNPNAKAAAANAADQVTTTVQDKWDIHSPSRVFAGLGSYAMDGLTLGIQKGTRMALNATRKMTVGLLGAAALTLPAVSMASSKAPAAVKQPSVAQQLNPTQQVLQSVQSISVPALPEVAEITSKNPVPDVEEQITSMAPSTTPLEVREPRTNNQNSKQDQATGQAAAGLVVTGNTIVFQMPEGTTQDQMAAFFQFLQSLQK